MHLYILYSFPELVFRVNFQFVERSIECQLHKVLYLKCMIFSENIILIFKKRRTKKKNTATLHKTRR